MLTVGYAGSLFRHQDTLAFDQNENVPVAAPTQAGCLASGQPTSAGYNFDPCINTNTTSANYSRPYPGFSNIYSEAGIGSGNYNAVQTGFVYRKNNVQTTVSYSFSKSLSQFGHTSNTGGGSIAGGGGGQGVQDWRNLAAEYAPSNFNRPHVLTFSGIYDIPGFRSSGNVLERQVLGGWSLATLSVLESGFALTPGLATSNPGLAIRPNQVAPIHLLKTKNEWFDTKAFAAPAYGFYGDASPASIRGPREISFNVAGYKTFPIYERFSLQFRAEAFNFVNHPNFGNVDTSVGSGSYGKINSALDPREMEFSARILF